MQNIMTFHKLFVNTDLFRSFRNIMSKLQDLIAQREAIEKAIKEARKDEVKQAVATIRGLVDQFNLSASDIFGGKTKAASGSRKPVAAKYRDPASGATWTGRGKAPKWIDGKDRAKFAI